ncbi:secreted protein [methanotrophic bacterial endosymbiont of Bathymodiolus sp.]|nr:secreted protein [methanotrophic bacterial endosymbiont of Bathymodiolus sp.]
MFIKNFMVTPLATLALSSSMEMSEMIIHADHMDVQLNYINPACQFMATSDGFVQTENTSVPGKIVETAVNSGSRCVR